MHRIDAMSPIPRDRNEHIPPMECYSCHYGLRIPLESAPSLLRRRLLVPHGVEALNLFGEAFEVAGKRAAAVLRGLHHFGRRLG